MRLIGRKRRAAYTENDSGTGCTCAASAKNAERVHSVGGDGATEGEISEVNQRSRVPMHPMVMFRRQRCEEQRRR